MRANAVKPPRQHRNGKDPPNQGNREREGQREEQEESGRSMEGEREGRASYLKSTAKCLQIWGRLSLYACQHLQTDVCKYLYIR